MFEIVLISFGIFGTCFINYQLYDNCIKKGNYNEIPELKKIKKEIEKENKRNDKILKKIINDIDTDHDFYIVKEVELQNNKK